MVTVVVVVVTVMSCGCGNSDMVVVGGSVGPETIRR